MNPVQARRLFDPGKVDRRFLCRLYNECLDRAVESRWEGFGCTKCCDFELEGGQDPAYWQEQSMRAARLLLGVAAS